MTDLERLKVEMDAAKRAARAAYDAWIVAKRAARAAYDAWIAAGGSGLGRATQTKEKNGD